MLRGIGYGIGGAVICDLAVGWLFENWVIPAIVGFIIGFLFGAFMG